MESNAKPIRSHRLRVTLPIRVRGMSAEQRFFDEETETLILSDHELMARIHAQPELDTEIHVTSLKNEVAGNFRVTWLAPQAENGAFDIGLEKIESEGDLWEMSFPAASNAADETLPQAQLECLRCHARMRCAIPEAEEEFLRPGFRTARPCGNCKATTAWEYVAEKDATEPVDRQAKAAADLRGKGRAPLRIELKVTRKMFGSALDDICQTENISRTGAYFYSRQNYAVGDVVSVVLPYKEGDVPIPVAARVVRVDKPSSGFLNGIAIQLLSGENRWGT